MDSLRTDNLDVRHPITAEVILNEGRFRRLAPGATASQPRQMNPSLATGIGSFFRYGALPVGLKTKNHLQFFGLRTIDRRQLFRPKCQELLTDPFQPHSLFQQVVERLNQPGMTWQVAVFFFDVVSRYAPVFE
jgi:hypothetical protein